MDVLKILTYAYDAKYTSQHEVMKQSPS